MNTESSYTERCDRCGKTYGDHCGNECPDREGAFTLPPINTKEPSNEYKEAIKCWAEINHSHDPDYVDRPVIIISRYLKEVREEDSNRLVAECDALKASNAALREQLAANTKSISELQHLVRLAQGTHAQQIHECAEKAIAKLRALQWISGDGDWTRTQADEKLKTIICEAFGAPVDEYEDALQKAWEARKVLGNSPAFPDFRDGFHAAWKLAKGEKP